MKNFFPVPNHIFEEKIPPLALLILFYLLRCRGADGKCYPSIQTIGKNLEIGKTSVITYTKWLEDNGYIVVEQKFRNGRQTNNSYHLTKKVSEDFADH